MVLAKFVFQILLISYKIHFVLNTLLAKYVQNVQLELLLLLISITKPIVLKHNFQIVACALLMNHIHLLQNLIWLAWFVLVLLMLLWILWLISVSKLMALQSSQLNILVIAYGIEWLFNVCRHPLRPLKNIQENVRLLLLNIVTIWKMVYAKNASRTKTMV